MTPEEVFSELSKMLEAKGHSFRRGDYGPVLDRIDDELVSVYTSANTNKPGYHIRIDNNFSIKCAYVPQGKDGSFDLDKVLSTVEKFLADIRDYRAKEEADRSRVHQYHDMTFRLEYDSKKLVASENGVEIKIPPIQNEEHLKAMVEAIHAVNKRFANG